METAAYYVALMMLLSSPYILVYWFVLHPLLTTGAAAGRWSPWWSSIPRCSF